MQEIIRVCPSTYQLDLIVCHCQSYRPMFKPLEEDEEGIVTVAIDSSMDVDDVVSKILEHC